MSESIYAGEKKVVTYDPITFDSEITELKEYFPPIEWEHKHKTVRITKSAKAKWPNGELCIVVQTEDHEGWITFNYMVETVNKEFEELPSNQKYERMRRIKYACGHSGRVLICAVSKEKADKRVKKLSQGKCFYCEHGDFKITEDML